MTREEFVRAYAQRSGTTVEGLRELGLRVYPCGPEQGCDYEKCEGWQMSRQTHCMRAPSVIGCCAGPGRCSCECNTCLCPLCDMNPCKCPPYVEPTP